MPPADPSSHSLPDGQSNPDEPTETMELGWFARLRKNIPPASILLLATVLVVAGAITMWGPVNLLAWRGGTFPDTEPDRPLYQANIKDLAREQYQQQPDHSLYFGTACGATDEDLLLALPAGFSTPFEQNVDTPADSLDAFGQEVDCKGSWDAAFVSWLLAYSGVPLYEFGEPGENTWLVATTEQLVDAYKEHDAYIEDDQFSPQVGDIIFYNYPGPFGMHANMVVAVQGDWVTVGGDEPEGVGLAVMQLRKRGGIVGYGATGKLEGSPLPTARI